MHWWAFSYSVGSLTLLVRVQNIFKQVLQEAGLLKQAWYCYTELHCDFSMKIVPHYTQLGRPSHWP